MKDNFIVCKIEKSFNLEVEISQNAGYPVFS
jgi:hypothetical protein